MHSGRHRRVVAGAVLLWAGLADCSLELHVPGPKRAADAGHDAGTSEDAGLDAGPPPKAIKHAGCSLAAEPPLPAEPFIARDAHGRPVFDYWADLTCVDPTVRNYPSCDTYRGGDSPCDQCAGEARLCMTETIDTSSTCSPYVSGTSPCTACVPPQAKRWACCQGIDKLCTSWPFDGQSPLHGPCAIHADCEPGLLCSTPATKFAHAYGICSCPGETAPTCWTKRVTP